MAQAGDPSGVARQVQPGRLEKAEQNSGLVVGQRADPTEDTKALTEDAQYKTEFVKIYQDAGVVGVSMLTLLVLCLLLGLFCSRLIKMYIALTESRDALETARTVAIEKLTTNMILLRNETATVVAELRREHTAHADKLQDLCEEQRQLVAQLQNLNRSLDERLPRRGR